MYSLNCNYYKKEFNSIDELIDDVLASGMDPNYEITRNGKNYRRNSLGPYGRINLHIYGI
jgi:hypothetical protein